MHFEYKYKALLLCRPGIVATAAAPATTAAAAAAAGFTISSSAVGNKCFAFEQRDGLRNSDGVIEEARAFDRIAGEAIWTSIRHAVVEIVISRRDVVWMPTVQPQPCVDENATGKEATQSGLEMMLFVVRRSAPLRA